MAGLWQSQQHKLAFQTPAFPRDAMLPSCVTVPGILALTFPKKSKWKRSPAWAESVIPEGRVNQNTTHKGTTDAFYLYLYLFSSWSCHFHLSAQNPGLLLKNLGQLGKMSAELQRRITVEMEFGVGEHGLTLIYLTLQWRTHMEKTLVFQGALYEGEKEYLFCKAGS